MYKKICLMISVLLLSSISFAQTKHEEIKARAEESVTALTSGDYQKFVDLTYPKLVEILGGRARMISSLETQMKEMKAHGFEISSASVDLPKEVVPVGHQLFAIVPYTLKMKAPGGVLTQQSYMLGISSRGSVKWMFIDVTNIDESKLKILLPSAVGKLALPKKQPPAFERNP